MHGDNVTVDRFRDSAAERAVLADILLYPEQAPRYVSAGFSGDHFADARNREVWRAIAALTARELVADLLAVREELQAHRSDVEASYLVALPDDARDGVPRQLESNILHRLERLDVLRRGRLAYYLTHRFMAEAADNPAALNNGHLGSFVDALLALHSSTEGAAPLMDDAAVVNLLEPQFLVAGVLPWPALVTLYGDPGIGKTFLSVDLGMSVALGIPWMGADVAQPSRVIYVAAEGAASLGPRIGAWKIAHEAALEHVAGLHVWSGAIALLQPNEIAHFIASVRPLLPRLVVLDTLARCLVGGDENSAKDMGLAIASADRIRRELQATVVLVHHSNKGGTSERGSSALRGASDSMLLLSKVDDLLRLTCEKQKDTRAFAPRDVTLVEVDGSGSCVVQPGIARQLADDPLTDAQSKVQHALASCFEADEGATRAELQRALTDVPDRTLGRSLAVLVERGYVRKLGKTHGKARYLAAVSGKEQSAKNHVADYPRRPRTLADYSAEGRP